MKLGNNKLIKFYLNITIVNFNSKGCFRIPQLNLLAVFNLSTSLQPTLIPNIVVQP